jgi:quercetin dioxygenase-like cupin family protein
MPIAEPGAATPDTSHGALWHLGGLLRIRAYGAETNGALAIVEEHARRGYRTPTHVHTREDETLYIIDGELSYRRGDEAGSAGPGDVVLLPRHAAHHFEVVSEYAHFLNIVSPAGFENFFAQVSGPALADRVPTGADGAHADRQTMAAAASRLGVTILGQRESSGHGLTGPAGAAALALAQAGSPPARTTAYHRLARLLTAPALPDDTRQVIWRLNSLVTRGECWFEAHAAVLLGITAERLSAAPGVLGAWQAAAWQDLTDAVPAYADRARQASGTSPSLAALYYLLAHFPAQADLIQRELKRRREPAGPDDEARLTRCLYQPDFTAPGTLALIGRVWPSPAVWHLSAAELEADARWRAAAGYSPAAAQALWEAETTALLAFMGANAEFALEETADA